MLVDCGRHFIGEEITVFFFVFVIRKNNERTELVWCMKNVTMESGWNLRNQIVRRSFLKIFLFFRFILKLLP